MRNRINLKMFLQDWSSTSNSFIS